MTFTAPFAGTDTYEFKPSGASSPNNQWVLNEECDPYEATLSLDYGGPQDFPFSSDCGFSVDVIEMFITER